MAQNKEKENKKDQLERIAEQLALLLIAFFDEQEVGKTKPEEPRRPNSDPGG